MARIDVPDLLKTAERYAFNLSKQEGQKNGSLDALQLEAEMEDKRRDFLRLSERVFFESIVEGSDLLPLRYLGTGQMAAKAVGRIQVSLADGAGEGFATGFLVAPGLLLTNQHVLRSPSWAEVATLTMDAEDGVDGLPLVPRIFRLMPDRLFIADEKLDFCFVAVAARAVDGTALDEYGHFRLFAETGKIVRGEYATIIQHPNGRQKHIAARDNRISVYVYDDPADAATGAGNDFIYYTTDTLRGSSGAPVMSDQWYVIALHRRGVPLVRARGGEAVVMRRNGKVAAPDDPEDVLAFVSNEGVRISRVLARLKEIAESPGATLAVSAAAALHLVVAAAGRPSQGPLLAPTRGYAPAQDDAPARPFGRPRLEIVRRKLSLFPEDRGYREDFLQGFRLPLPRPSTGLAAELAPRLDRPDRHLLPFRHFTTAMHARRRLPVFAALNISGSLKPEGSMGRRPPWSYDPRIDPEHQPDDSIFSNQLQRGHLAARDYVYWGEDEEEIREADVHSFTLTNVCPQIARFNGNREWYEIERQVTAGAQAEALAITEFVGPIFSGDDPLYDDLRRGRQRTGAGTGIRIPLRFWKIVFWVEAGALRHRRFSSTRARNSPPRDRSNSILRCRAGSLPRRSARYRR